MMPYIYHAKWSCEQDTHIEHYLLGEVFLHNVGNCGQCFRNDSNCKKSFENRNRQGVCKKPNFIDPINDKYYALQVPYMSLGSGWSLCQLETAASKDLMCQKDPLRR